MFEFKKVIYKKFKEGDSGSEVEASEIFPLNVWFEKNIELINQLKEVQAGQELTLAELLIGYFEFYVKHLNPAKHVVSINFP